MEASSPFAALTVNWGLVQMQTPVFGKCHKTWKHLRFQHFACIEKYPFCLAQCC